MPVVILVAMVRLSLLSSNHSCSAGNVLAVTIHNIFILNKNGTFTSIGTCNMSSR